MTPTLAQLKAEAVWQNESTPPSLVVLGKQLQQHFGLPAGSIGWIGDEHHLKGYHRSRAWIKGSKYVTNETYSITENEGNRHGGKDNWVSAIDITMPLSKLVVLCRRLDAHTRAGHLEKITEWYGNLGGDQRVDGYDNIRNRAATSDASHLAHVHMSFDRGRVGESHNDVFNMLAGIVAEPPEGPPPTPPTPPTPPAPPAVDAVTLGRIVNELNAVQTEDIVTAVAARVGMIPTAGEIARQVVAIMRETPVPVETDQG